VGVPILWRNDEIREPLAMHFLQTPPEHRFGLPIPTEDMAGLINCDVCIQRGLEDRDQPGLGGSQQQLRPLALDRIADHTRQQFTFDSSFDQVILRAGAHGFQRHLLVIESRDDHDRLVAGVLLHVPERLKSLTVGQPQIQEHHIDAVLLQMAHGRVQPVSPFQLELGPVLLLAQHFEDEAGVAGIVFHQQHTNRSSRYARGHGSFTISSQNAPIALTAFRNTAGSIGFVT